VRGHGTRLCPRRNKLTGGTQTLRGDRLRRRNDRSATVKSSRRSCRAR